MSAVRVAVMLRHGPKGSRRGLRATLLVAGALLSTGGCSCQDGDRAAGWGDEARRATPTVSAPRTAGSVTASVEYPLQRQGARFEGSICGLCPPDVWADLPFVEDADAPENSDWEVLLGHPFADTSAGLKFGRRPLDLRDALRHEIPVDLVPGHRAVAIGALRYRLSPVWIHEPQLGKQRPLRGINGRDTLVSAWIKRGRWFQVLSTRRAFALRTSFEPRCGRGTPEQVAAALALAHELLPAVQPALCAERWRGGSSGLMRWAGFFGRPLTMLEEWPRTISIVINGDRVMFSFRDPYNPGRTFGNPVPPWFDEKLPAPTATPRPEGRNSSSRSSTR